MSQGGQVEALTLQGDVEDVTAARVLVAGKRFFYEVEHPTTLETREWVEVKFKWFN
jgi:hypothetical protein